MTIKSKSVLSLCKRDTANCKRGTENCRRTPATYSEASCADEIFQKKNLELKDAQNVLKAAKLKGQQLVCFRGLPYFPYAKMSQDDQLMATRREITAIYDISNQRLEKKRSTFGYQWQLGSSAAAQLD
jgi:hypothetical protein